MDDDDWNVFALFRHQTREENGVYESKPCFPRFFGKRSELGIGKKALEHLAGVLKSHDSVHPKKGRVTMNAIALLFNCEVCPSRARSSGNVEPTTIWSVPGSSSGSVSARTR